MTVLSRRGFLMGSALAGPLWSSVLLRRGIAASVGKDGIAAIEHQGVLIKECTLPGQTLADDVVPRHGTCIQVSRDRWLIVYQTHGFRGVDDERSIVYQLRRKAPDGPVIKEGFLARDQADWDPLGDGGRSAGEGKCYFKQHGHAVAFGVPKGALIDGQPAPHANLFVAKWRVLARVLDCRRDYLEHRTQHLELGERTQNVEWVQFRLNDRENDIEILQPVGHLRQRGYEEGPAFCSAPGVRTMNQSYTPPVPFDRTCTEWADCNHFDQDGSGWNCVAALKYRFEPQLGRYEWVETGPLVSDPPHLLFEASLAQFGGDWIIGTRLRDAKGGAWVRSGDPFSRMPPPVHQAEPPSNSPRTVFLCPDGFIRLFTGDPMASPHRNGRDPLYCWNVDPNRQFACTNRRVIFDSVQAGIPLRREVSPKVDFCALFPPHGRTQLAVHSVCTRAYNFPYENRLGIPAVSAAEKALCAMCYARITYQDEYATPWEFPSE